jgi:hypothetical protein
MNTSKNIMVLFKDDQYDDIFPEELKEELEIVREIIPWTKKIEEKIIVGGKGVPFVQIEMSRALYLSKKYFDEINLKVKESRILDLNKKVWKVLSNSLKNL